MTALPKTALRLLSRLADAPQATASGTSADLRTLIDSDLAAAEAPGIVRITPAGRAWLARRAAENRGATDPFRAQHLALGRRRVVVDGTASEVCVDERESPLAWLARRKGRDGRALIEPHQFQAGERLRGSFDMANLMPRTTANWQAAVARDRRSGDGSASMTDTMIAARQQVHRALDAVGPEFSGLLLDICCFLKRLEDVERERQWPARSAKIVLQLALDRLARHYGLGSEARGRLRAPITRWSDGEAAAERCGA